MGLVLKVFRNVESSVAKHVRKFMHVAEERFNVVNRIALILAPAATLAPYAVTSGKPLRTRIGVCDAPAPDEKVCFACFIAKKSEKVGGSPPGCQSVIYVAANLAVVSKSAKRRRMIVWEHICHELVHYEQWRDGREMNERGVERRARAMLSRMMRDVPGFAS